MILPVPADEIDRYWPLVSSFVDRVTDHMRGEFWPEDFRRMCRDNSMQLWVIVEGDAIVGAVTTEVIDYPRKRALRVVTVGGEGWSNWGPELSQAMDQFAEKVKASEIEACGRRGWERKLPALGYAPVYVTYCKPVGG